MFPFGNAEPEPLIDMKMLATALFTILAVILAYIMLGTKKNLDPTKFIKYKLIAKNELTPNVVLCTFELPDLSKCMGLPVGNHIQARLTEADGEQVCRSYTPSEWREKGKFDILFKVYPGGKMTKHMANLAVGQYMEFRGPTGRMQYMGNGVVGISNFKKTSMKTNTHSCLVLLCGGTGLTPMLQIAKAALDDPNDNTPIYMLFANSTPKDAIYTKQLEELQEKHDKQFILTLGVSRNPAHMPWAHHVGRFNTETLNQFLEVGWLPKVEDSVGIAICGPPSFEKAMAASIKEVGYSKKLKTMRW